MVACILEIAEQSQSRLLIQKEFITARCSSKEAAVSERSQNLEPENSAVVITKQATSPGGEFYPSFSILESS